MSAFKLATMHLNRRHALLFLGANAWAMRPAWADAPGSAPGRLVLVFLRGAYDGISALVPHGDAQYYKLRPSIAIAQPDGGASSALALDKLFGLHPAMAGLLPLWQQGVLAAIPGAGSPDSTRSHFDAQHHWETGLPGSSAAGAGWMNSLSKLYGTERSALGVGEANPQILAGPQAVQLVASGQAATRAGALADTRTREAILKMYAANPSLAQSAQAGADSRMQTAATLTQAQTEAAMAAAPQGMASAPDKDQAIQQAANNGAPPVQGLALDAQNLGTLMGKNRQLRLGFLSAGGWDTHLNQGNTTGTLANNLGNLSRALLQLRRHFSEPHDVVVVASEFGRTCAENGTRGTDHGHGNVMWVMGNAVAGGRWHGQWSGLAQGNLNEGRDLPVHHDFRAVFAQILAGTQGVAREDTERLFPGYRWDARLDGLLRA